ncbi:SDR family NAD(P)-dependent oxidoreductase [Butyrivibrio sp. AC2005]|uniref:SDR family NAD(P)-dependent oxidoreductase n=1 Tax=Butyrivibrio sp. AC2005 TaxID=1280672 RepID=UPI000402A746|nr:SDR family NAD(P)-dependent oxidoreductase [Butyrivibrio sp. AC2005]
MKTVVITGSTRGLGYEMATAFLRNDWNVVINGVNENRLNHAVESLKKIKGKGDILGVAGNIAKSEDIQNLMDSAVKQFGAIDIWINNAGVNQPSKAIWELTDSEIDALLNIDLRGAILGTKIATLQMEKQSEGGMIYTVEGYGSNDAMMLGLNMYGTTKRAVTHFSKAYAKELEERNSRVRIGRLSPGIMITDFTKTALGGEQEIELSEKTKNVYNMLGDYPDVVAKFLVREMLKDPANDVHINWLTGRKVMFRLITAPIRKRSFFD